MDEMILNNCPISTQGNQDEITDCQCNRGELELYVTLLIMYWFKLTSYSHGDGPFRGRIN